MKTILLIYATLAFFSYTLWIYRKYGVLTSISASINYIKNKFLFTFFIWSVAIPLTITAMIVHPNFFGFFAGGILAFVGAAPCITKDNMEERVHVFGATGGITLGMIYICTINIWYIIVAGLYLLFVTYCVIVDKYCGYEGTNKIKLYISKLKRIYNHTWWIEVVAFVILIVVLWIN